MSAEVNTVSYTFWVCDVCRLLDNDMQRKPVSYCPLCDAWICIDDRDKWLRRARAAVRRKLEPGYKGQPDYKTGSEYDKMVGLDGTMTLDKGTDGIYNYNPASQ